MAPRLFSTPNSRYCTRSGSAITANGSRTGIRAARRPPNEKHHLGDSTVRNLLVPVGEAAQVQVADRTGREPPKLQVCPSGRSRDVHRLIVDVLQTASRHGRTAGQSSRHPNTIPMAKLRQESVCQRADRVPGAQNGLACSLRSTNFPFRASQPARNPRALTIGSTMTASPALKEGPWQIGRCARCGISFMR